MYYIRMNCIKSMCLVFILGWVVIKFGNMILSFFGYV